MRVRQLHAVPCASRPRIQSISYKVSIVLVQPRSLQEEKCTSAHPITQEKSIEINRKLFIKTRSVKSWHILCMINLKPLRGWENILCGSHYYSVSLSFLWDARNAVDNHVSELQIHPSINLNA